MKILIFLVFLAWMPGFNLATAAGSGLDQIKNEEKFLSENGILKFFDRAISENWQPPLIRSEWAIEKVAAGAKKQQQQASFDLGKTILNALTELASQKSGTPQEALTTASKLAAFSEWISKEKGYGNALIARRSLDLASPLFGLLIIDPKTSEQDLPTIGNFLKPSWITVAFKAAVLDSEGSFNVFAEAKTEDDLHAIWREGYQQALDAKDPNWKNSLPAGFSLNLPDRLPLNIEPSKLQFFIDDPMPVPPSSKELLEGKYHELIITSLEPLNVAKLRELLSFRIALKSFPTESVKSDFYPGLQGAFDESWRTFYKANGAPPGTSIKMGLAAWNAYSLIKDNQLLPEDEILVKP